MRQFEDLKICIGFNRFSLVVVRWWLFVVRCSLGVVRFSLGVG
jgi:hypothetical protein